MKIPLRIHEERLLAPRSGRRRSSSSASRPRIVVLLGPVPVVPGERNYREARRLSSAQVGAMVVLSAVAFVLLAGWLASIPG